MTDENTPIEPVQPIDGPPVEPPAQKQPPGWTPTPPAGPGRMFRIRSVLAVAAAGVIVGGLGGATITHLADHSDRSDHGFSDRGGFPGGQVPAGPPNDRVPSVPRDDSEDQPSGSSEGASAS
jgi:hypothetical protein